MTAYGDIVDVEEMTFVNTSSETEQPATNMSEYEYQLCLIIILSVTFEETYPQGGSMIKLDKVGARRALRCYGYSEYEVMPMLWETLDRAVLQYPDKWTERLNKEETV